MKLLLRRASDEEIAAECRSRAVYVRAQERIQSHKAAKPGGAFGTFWVGGHGEERTTERRRLSTLWRAMTDRASRLEAAALALEREGRDQ